MGSLEKKLGIRRNLRLVPEDIFSYYLKDHKYILGVLTKKQQLVTDLVNGVSDGNCLDIADIANIIGAKYSYIYDAYKAAFKRLYNVEIIHKLMDAGITDDVLGCTADNYQEFTKEKLQKFYDSYLLLDEPIKTNIGEDIRQKLESKFDKILKTPIKDLGFSEEISSKFDRMTIAEYLDREGLEYFSNKGFVWTRLSKLESATVADRLREFDLIVKYSGYMDDAGMQEWFQMLKEVYVKRNAHLFEKEKLEQIQVEETGVSPADINEIPERYRELYSIGAGIKAQQEMANESFLNVFKRRMLSKRKIDISTNIHYNIKQNDGCDINEEKSLND